jgi:ABC-type transporter Mla maintaining outer membrane lipid asymmetry ATPase subunit MlaF
VTPPALAIAGLTKDYRGLRPLRIQQLTVGHDDTVAILGFDQASAEVFVNLVTGATLPDAGTVHAFGHATSAIADGDEWLQTLDRFGIVTERAVLLDQLTVVQNLAMPFTLDIEPPPDDVRARAETIAQEVGLHAASWPGRIADLDAPARTRIRLGRALAADPALLILEHTSAGLAKAATVTLGTDIRRIAAARGIALVAATADEAFAHAVARRVLTLEPASGRLTERRRGWFK